MARSRLVIVYGIQAGIFASLASIFGKLALNESEIVSTCIEASNYLTLNSEVLCYKLSPLLRVISTVLIFTCNSLMWLFYTKSLSTSSTTAAAVAINTAANFLFTGFAGAFLFKETLTWKWFIGTMLMLVGVLCINRSITISSSSSPVLEKDLKLKAS